MRKFDIMGFSLNGTGDGNALINEFGMPYVGDVPYNDWTVPNIPVDGLRYFRTLTTSEPDKGIAIPDSKDYVLAKLGDILDKNMVIIGIVSRETFEPIERYAIKSQDYMNGRLSWGFDVKVYKAGKQVAAHDGYCLLIKLEKLTKIYYRVDGKWQATGYNSDHMIGSLV